MYVAGDFSTVGGQARARAAAIDLSTGLANSMSQDLLEILEIKDSKLLITSS
jgi:hypothetical protein